MLRIAAAFACGLLFGAGLTVAQMINPQKVLNFLDVGAAVDGGWDPSLALVLVAAVATTAVGYRLTLGRDRPLLAGAFSLPKRSDVDVRLIVGAAVFGLGWGLVGFCPGPALAVLGIGGRLPVMFVAAMLVGMAIYHLIFERSTSNKRSSDPLANVRS